MADAVTTQTLSDTSGVKSVVKMTNISDGTGETLVTKMDASALNGMSEDATKKVSKIWYSVNTTNGKSGVELLWAGSGSSAANKTICVLSGNGFWDLKTAGNEIANNATLTASTSPAGDILLSTKGFVSGDNYSIIVEVRQMAKKRKDYSREILERIVGSKRKTELAEKFREAFADKYSIKREELKKGIVDKIYNKEKVER